MTGEAVYLKPGDTLYLTIANGVVIAIQRIAHNDCDALLFRPTDAAQGSAGIPIHGCGSLRVGEPLHTHGAAPGDYRDYDTAAPITDIWHVRAKEVM